MQHRSPRRRIGGAVAGEACYALLAIHVAVPARFRTLPLPRADSLGWWRFNEQPPGKQTTGVAGEFVDATGNGQHANAVGDALPSYVAGAAGPQYFDGGSAVELGYGNDRIIVPDGSAFDLRLADLRSYRIEADMYTMGSSGSVIFSRYNDGEPDAGAPAATSSACRKDSAACS